MKDLRKISYTLLFFFAGLISETTGSNTGTSANDETSSQTSSTSFLRRNLNNGKGQKNNKKRVIVKYKKGKKDIVKAKIKGNGLGPNFIFDMDNLNVLVLELPEPALQALLNNKNKDIETVEEDPKVYPIETLLEDSNIEHGRYLPQEPTYGIEMVKADKVEQTGAGVTICIIDSGIASSHPDLQLGEERLNGEGNNGVVWSEDTCGHGTHIAGTIAAQNNTIGVVGVAPGANIYIVKAFDGSSCGYTYGSAVLNAAYSCKDAGANIISMSLAATDSTPTLAAGWTSLLEEHNVLSIAAAGNGLMSTYAYPASHDPVVSVAAVDSSENIWSQSQQNDRVDIAAPGVSIKSTIAAGTYGKTTNTYGYLSGTSMAAPHVAGVAALIWQKYNTFSALQVRQQLLSTTKDLGAQGRDNAYGHGLVDALAAMSPACSVDSECNDFDDCTADTCVDNMCFWTADLTCKYQELTPSTPITISEDTIGGMQTFWLRVTPGESVTCTISGGSGDADLYVRFDEAPTTGIYDCRPLSIGSDEECSFSSIESDYQYLFVGVEAYNAFSGVTLECVRYSQLEIISVDGVNRWWKEVPLSPGFQNPVPVCTVHFKDGLNYKPRVVRMRNVQQSSFEIKLQNPNDEAMSNLKVSCIVVEEGTHILPNGQRIEAHTMTSTITARSDNWVFQDAPSSLADFTTPLVLGQVITANDPRWSAFITVGESRYRIPSLSGDFRMAKHVGEDSITTREDETLGYIVMESNHGILSGIEYEAGVTSDSIQGFDPHGRDYPFDSEFSSVPGIVVASQCSMDGFNGSWAIAFDSTSTTILKIAVDEDRLKDSERYHPTEQVAYVAFDTPSGASSAVLQLTKTV